MSKDDSNQTGATGDIIRLWVRKGQTRIEPSQDGIRLDRFLARKFTYRSRTQWGKVIRDGRITLNSLIVRPSRVLRTGDLIGYVPLEQKEPPVDTNIDIIYQDPHLVVIAKSGNLPIHPSGSYFKHTLLHYLSREYPELGHLLVIHRLDRETSGAIVFGRTKPDTAFIATQFQQRQVKKRYLAIVEGVPDRDTFVIDHPLGNAANSLIRKAVGVCADGITAVTDCRVLHRGQDWSLIEASPRTGRLHQIRAHLKSVALPILGDKVYGQSEELFLKFVSDDPFTARELRQLGMDRQALHAWQLEITHPQSKELICFTAPLPDDMAEVLDDRGLNPSPWQNPAP